MWKYLLIRYLYSYRDFYRVQGVVNCYAAYEMISFFFPLYSVYIYLFDTPSTPLANKGIVLTGDTCVP